MIIEPTHPKVFVSHASEDKDRFVIPFAEQLRARGIDVWVDRWEMLVGDSLVAKIFREGLENASAVIVVLSRHSIGKAWVTEELDAAVVKRINEGSKLIPVVLDGLDPKTEVPPSIRHLLLEIVPNTAEREQVVESVERAIHGDVRRPPLGDLPAYTRAVTARIPGLDRIDSLILRSMGDEAVRDSGDTFDTAEFVASIIVELSINEAQVIDSLEVLDASGQLKISRTMGPRLSGMRRFTITRSGLETYLRAYEPEYSRIEATIIARLAGWPGGQGTERELVAAVGAPDLIIRHLLGTLAARGHLKLSKPSGPQGWRFYNISPRLRRIAVTDR